MQHKVRGEVPGKRCFCQSAFPFQLHRDGELMQSTSNAQLIFEYAFGLSQHESVEYPSERAALLLDCLRLFPKNAHLHILGINALLNLIDQQRLYDDKAQAELLKKKQSKTHYVPDASLGEAKSEWAQLGKDGWVSDHAMDHKQHDPTDFSVTVPKHVQQFSLAVFEYLKFPMRICEEHVQWRTLE